MTRREFTMFLGGAAAWPLAALAQPRGRIPVIGYLVLANPEPDFAYFREGLLKLGYRDGGNIRIEFRSAEGKPERLARLAAELVRLKVDVLVARQTPAATAAKQASAEIPIVMAGVGNPVGTGLITSLARPGGNITGITGVGEDMAVKTLELFREIMPSVKRVGVLANATDPFTKPFLEQIQLAGRTMSLEISPSMIRETTEIRAALADMVKRRMDVVIVQPSLHRRTAAEGALTHRLPAVSAAAQFPDAGGLVAYSANAADILRESAVYVDKILKGARPADLPVQQPTKFELIVNLRTAKALGITIPQSIVLRADRVIE